MDTLAALADDYYEYAMAEDPILLMWTGKTKSLALWNDFSPAGMDARKAANLDFHRRATAIDTDGDPQRTALRDVIAASSQATARGLAWTSELFHVNPKMGAFEMVMSFVDNFELVTAEHGEAYLTKLRTMPAAFAQLADVATASAAEGVVALSRHLTATAAGVDAHLATPHDADDRLCAQAPPTGLDDDAKQAWTDERNRIVSETVRPGLAEYSAALRTLASRGMSDDKPGLTHLPGGDAVYRDKIYEHTLLDKDPAEIHQIGLDQIAKLEDEYREIAGPLFGTTDIAEIYARLRDDESLKYRDAATLIADAELALKKADQALPEAFSVLPTTPCLAESTNFGAMAYYSSPDPETGKPGKFFFNTSDPAAWSTYELEAIVFHEGVPGHHLHLALNAENTSLHPVQSEFHNTAYAEGWGLYTERLADEMGLYSSDMSRIGMLSADSLRACRLVVDTGMHALGWSREQAIQYKLDHSPMDRVHIEQEVDRYIGLPGQALAYMIGRLEIMDMRAAAQALPGYDIKDFHDKFLRYGSVPLSTARAQVLADH